jgi:hypothetical protein
MAHDGERSFANVLENVVGDIQEIIRAEVRLAKAEVREETVKAGRAAGMLGAGAVLALYAGGLLLLTALFALETALAPWVAALILTAMVGIAAAVLISVGRKRVKQVDPRPDKTIRTIKENVAWVRNQTR